MTAIAGGLTRKCVHWFQSCCYHHYINVMYIIIISWLTSHLVDKIKPNALDRSASQALWYHGVKNKVVTSQCSHIHHRLMVDEFPVNFNTGATNLYWHIFQTVTLAYEMTLACNDDKYDTRVIAPAWSFDVFLCRIAFECAHRVASVI